METAQLILYILQGTQLVGTLFPTTVEALLALQKIFSVDGSDFTTQVQILQDGALKDAGDTELLIVQWKQTNGYKD